MSEYGSIVYGSGFTYGTFGDIELVQPISSRLILLRFTGGIVVDELYTNTDNYTVEVVEGSGAINVLRVFPVNTSSSTDILLVTNVMTEGTRYRVTTGLLTGRGGSNGTGTGEFYARITKTDSVLRSIPKHFDKRPESNISSILTAITQQDEIIGGSRSDTLTYGVTETLTLPDAPVVAFDGSSPLTVYSFSYITGTFTDATRIALFVDDIYFADATLDSGAGTWSVLAPYSYLTYGVDSTVRAAAIGPGGPFETSITIKAGAEPDVLSGLFSWYTGADITADGSNNILTWPDRASGLGTLTPPGTNPILITDVDLNNQPAADWSGVSAPLDSAVLGSPQAQPYTLFMVLTRDAVGTAHSYADKVPAGTNQVYVTASATNTLQINAGTTLTSVSSVGIGAHKFAVTCNGASSDLYLDNWASIDTTSNVGTTALESLRLGVSSTGTQPLDGSIAEVVIYSRVLTPTEIAAVGAYIDALYAL